MYRSKQDDINGVRNKLENEIERVEVDIQTLHEVGGLREENVNAQRTYVTILACIGLGVLLFHQPLQQMLLNKSGYVGMEIRSFPFVNGLVSWVLYGIAIVHMIFACVLGVRFWRGNRMLTVVKDLQDRQRTLNRMQTSVGEKANELEKKLDEGQGVQLFNRGDFTFWSDLQYIHENVVQIQKESTTAVSDVCEVYKGAYVLVLFPIMAIALLVIMFILPLTATPYVDITTTTRNDNITIATVERETTPSETASPSNKNAVVEATKAPVVKSIAAGNVTVNDIVTFGNYEQDNYQSNGKEAIEWIVLDVNRSDNRVLLLSRYALDMRRYHSKYSKVSWKNCGLRSWLNGTFYKAAFSSSERKALVKTSLVSNYGNESSKTTDRVFCLSYDELKRYIPSNGDRVASPTPYAVAQKVDTNGRNQCYWWLRGSTQRKNDADRVKRSGEIQTYGGNTNAEGVGVRPAVWVDMGKISSN